MAQTSLFFQDEVLPGVLTEIQQNYSTSNYYTTTWGTTSSVLVLGTAFNGPVNQLVQIYSPEHALYVFGNTYDSATYREASLVTGIQDAYDKGCRSIYACRISGKEMYKDFEIAPDLGYRLRVSSAYPSNSSKNAYFRFINSGTELKFVYYKPSDRATVSEKMNGVVESSDSMIETVLDLSDTYGLTEKTRLADLISTVNSYQLNNVIRLSIVTDTGADVTYTDPTAQNLPMNSIFEGIYFIGRDKSTVSCCTLVDNKIASENPFWKNYSNVTTYKSIKINTDINSAYPISCTYNDMRNIFTGITTASLFDFISDVDSVDVLFPKDDIDYDEVDISGFDLYKTLGSGYATTACIELKNPSIQNPTAKDYVVKETPDGNSNRIVPISDGVYSVLQNISSDYRVLSHSCATERLDNAKLPTKSDFLSTISGSVHDIKTDKGVNAIKATPIVTDTTIADIDVQIKVDIVDDDYIAESIDYADNGTVKALLFVAADDVGTVPTGSTFVLNDTTGGFTLQYKSGDTSYIALPAIDAYNNSMFYDINNNKMYKYTANAAEATSSITEIANKSAFTSDDFSGGKAFFLISFDDKIINVAEFADNGIKIIASLKQILDKDYAGFYTTGSLVGSTKPYGIAITKDYASSNTYEVFLADLSASDLGNIFTFQYADQFGSYRNEYLDAEVAALATTQTTAAGKFAMQIFDTTKYIPYKTTDNLARQLAQHCTYTALKTGATHGIIGYTKIGDLSLTNIANTVTAACNANFDLYAKRNNGKSMLDKDNMPYAIGRNISITFGGYYVSTPDNYQYVSAGAAGYAGMLSALPIDQASTNQPINISSLLFTLSNYQLTNLTNAGYVTFKDSYTKGIVVTDGITMAPTGSEYKRLSTTRIIGTVETIIRTACEPFIGKNNSLSNRNSLDTAVKSALYKIMGTLINDFDFVVASDLNQQKLGIIDIDYIVVPFYEIRQIRNRITIRDSI